MHALIFFVYNKVYFSTQHDGNLIANYIARLCPKKYLGLYWRCCWGRCYPNREWLGWLIEKLRKQRNRCWCCKCEAGIESWGDAVLRYTIWTGLRLISDLLVICLHLDFHLGATSRANLHRKTLTMLCQRYCLWNGWGKCTHCDCACSNPVNEVVFAEIHVGRILSDLWLLHEKRGLRPFSTGNRFF